MILLGSDEPKEIGEVLRRYVEVGERGTRLGYIIHVGDYSVECHRVLIDDYIQKLYENVEDGFQNLFIGKTNLSILFIIGYFTPSMMDVVIRRETYINSLIKLLVKRIVPIVLESDYEMIIFMKNLHSVLMKEEKINEINKLIEIKGIGFTTAKMLLKKFGSIENIKNTPAYELINCGISLNVIKELKRR